MIKFNKLKNYIDSRDKILDFNTNFINFINEIANIYNNYFCDNQLNKIILKISDNDIRNKLITEENNCNNLLKVLIIYVIDEYISINKSRKISYKYNSHIYYSDIVKKIINSIFECKEKLILNKTDNEIIT
jgi:hypothetical protein